MKTIKGSKKKGTSMPDTVEGAEGPDEILDKFREVYGNLYNSAESIDAMKGIKTTINGMIDHDSTAEINKITGDILKEACCKMKPGKSDVSGAFTSDILLHSPDSLFDKMAAVFRSYFVHGDVTLELLSCAFLPLLKSSLKDPSKTDSYRAIAGSSQILKLLDDVVLLLWGNLLETVPYQFGFKPGTSTTECSWMVMEVAGHFLRNGSPAISCLLDCSKAFDKCKIDKLFKKLLDREVPAIVIRVLIFVYEEQEGCVKLVGIKSVTFKITNGTRQGSVLSPVLFAVYLDGLLVELQNLGVGCHVAGVWFGAACYADDLILLSPSRTAMAMMLEVCEKYAASHNLVFSTDPNPAKSKSKCIYMCGQMNNVKKPEELQLNGKDLPWVESATHIGHELHQMCNMDFDIKIKRAQFIDTSTNIRDVFSFANPDQVLRAISLYCGHCYGSMLWDLSSEMSGQFFRSWSTAVKLAWGVPRSTHTYLVNHLLAVNHSSFREQLLVRYVKFFSKLRSSKATPVKFLVNIVASDIRSTTARNLHLIQQETDIDPWVTSGKAVEEKLLREPVPNEDIWRLPLLCKFLMQRQEMEIMMGNTEGIYYLVGCSARKVKFRQKVPVSPISTSILCH